MDTIAYVSVHGGHSGQFCSHATDTLEAIVDKYIELGFSWVGITEHSPPQSEALLYPEERAAGLSPRQMQQRFENYMTECRRLKEKYRTRIQLYAGMEIETCSGFETYIPELINRFRPDYIVGSVHHIDDIGFDYSPEQYAAAVDHCGSLEELYCRYFDQQYAMLTQLKPAVVGHFDLIRIFDPDYRANLLQPAIMERIERNLEFIAAHDLIIDYNLRALLKGSKEPYVSEVILQKAKALSIAVVPGDDSHGLSSVGAMMAQGITILRRFGFSTDWVRPRLHRP